MAGSGLFSISGVVSGLQSSSIVQQLITADSGPLNDLKAQQSTDQTKLTQYQTLNTDVLGLQVAAEGFTNGSAFGATQATPSDPSIMTATAGTGAVSGSYQMTVTQLAQSSQILSQGLATGATLGTGTVTVSIGSGSSTPITLTSSNDTLQGLASAINAANSGVQAAVVSDGSSTPDHLMLTSTATGAGENITVSSNLTGGTAPTFSTLQQAQPAILTLGTGANALTVNSQTNTVTGAIPGVTLNLLSVSPSTSSPVTVTVQPDTSAMQSSISSFISAYNTVNDFFGTALAYDASTNTGGPLLGDSAATQIQNSLADIMNTGGGTTFQSLAAIGITQNASGDLSISNQTELTNALQNNLSGVADLFNNPTTGVATQVNSYITGITAANNGVLTVAQQFLTDDMTDLTSSISDQQTMLNNEQTELTQQFTSMETSMAMLQSQNAAVASLDAMNGTSSSSSSSSSSPSSSSGSSSGTSSTSG